MPRRMIREGIKIIDIEEAESLNYNKFVTFCPICGGMVLVETQEDDTLKSTCETRDCVVNRR
ncbi:hypothetical protein LCGC14_0680370 [marine sediment metagenome]|uniref:Uncharacterized protein n=1 Tax=marine sediment metagenome TaxID=412755 RepID=A0A0F9QTC5_9ZZZZ